MITTISRTSKCLAACAVWAALMIPTQLPADPFETSGRAGLTQEKFAAAPTDDRTRWVSDMTADLQLDALQNVKAFEILTWGLRDPDPAVRKAAAWGAREYLSNLRQTCRGTNAGKLPIKRAVIEEFGKALKPLFADPDKLVRADAIVSHIWLRGSADECAEEALKLMDELSLDIAMEWGRRRTILTLMYSTGFPEERLPPDYPHPNSRKAGEPPVGTKFASPGRGKDPGNTWFDFLANSLP